MAFAGRGGVGPQIFLVFGWSHVPESFLLKAAPFLVFC